ncbi:MAG TPA: anti-sigma factor [Tepidisphaeraceae bacterium]|nr:anti-sigma factor [Tepidisphaeraceae bacterium]
MTCDERQDLILLYAADALDAGEREAVAAHVAAGCARCAGALAEARAVMAAMALTAEPLAAPPGARDRLTSRLERSVTTTAATTSPPLAIADYARPGLQRPRKAWALGRVATALAAACVAALLSGLAVWFALHERARLPMAAEVQYVALQGGDTQPLARGRIFWDTVRHQWHVYAFDMKPPPAGRTYQLWFVTSESSRIPAGTFSVDAGGKGSLKVPLPQDIAPIVAAAVTDEPSGGSAQPTGSIHLLGKARW